VPESVIAAMFDEKSVDENVAGLITASFEPYMVHSC
jgi:hypothetical protein